MNQAEFILTTRDDSGVTPLMIAVQANAPASLLELLIDAGALVNDTDYSYNTALHVAAHEGRVEAARVLLKHGGNSMRI
jgi:ankyrin repeat protein